MSVFNTLAIDLDGTMLVGEEIPRENLAAARRARQAGFDIIIATARWRKMASRIAAQIGISTPIIACSGAQVYDPNTDRDVIDDRLPADFSADLLALCDETRCIATLTFSERTLLKLDGMPDPADLPEEIEWTPRLTGADVSLPRIAAIQGSVIIKIIREELLPRFSDSVQAFDSIGPNGKIVLTITNCRADKGTALTAACRHHGVDLASVVAFGDAENDVAMFKVAGASVAMGQADEQTRSQATSVTLPNTEAGVAHAIDRLLATGAP